MYLTWPITHLPREGRVRHDIVFQTTSYTCTPASIAPARHRSAMGNPRHGRQVKRFDELDGYWIGEAVFVTAPHP